MRRCCTRQDVAQRTVGRRKGGESWLAPAVTSGMVSLTSKLSPQTPHSQYVPGSSEP
jgi:hypothetical protein